MYRKKTLEIQKILSKAVILQDKIDYKLELESIAGLDVAYDIKSSTARAAMVVLSFPALEVLEEHIALCPVTFPYIPGLLSFREAGPLLQVLEKVGGARPGLLMVDGHGVAHPRRLGIAAHLGLLTGIASIGVAKKKLYGYFDPPGIEKFESSVLYSRRPPSQNKKDPQRTSSKASLRESHKSRNKQQHEGPDKERDIVGTVLRSRKGVKPVFVSAGHLISQKTALEIVAMCLGKYRLPEPTRLADKLSKFRPEISENEKETD